MRLERFPRDVAVRLTLGGMALAWVTSVSHHELWARRDSRGWTGSLPVMHLCRTVPSLLDAHRLHLGIRLGHEFGLQLGSHRLRLGLRLGLHHGLHLDPQHSQLRVHLGANGVRARGGHRVRLDNQDRSVRKRIRFRETRRVDARLHRQGLRGIKVHRV